MRLFTSILLVTFLAFLAAARAGDAQGEAAPIQITIDAAKTGPPTNHFIYGQFIEHLGRCIYGGIWAEMLEDRKFYYPISDKYDPYRDLKDSKFPVIGASPWQVVGPSGSVTMVKKGAFVGEHSPRIAAGNGIRQNDLGLVAGKEYVGYVWVHIPEGSAKVAIKFGVGDKHAMLGVGPFATPNASYQRIPLEFTAIESTIKGWLEINVEDAPCILEPFHSCRPTTFADWRDGIGPRDRRPTRKNPAWTGIDSNDVGVDEFLDLCHEIGAEPMIAVNTGFGDDYSATQEVEYVNGPKETIGGRWRVENSHIDPYAVKYWCVGNEMWGQWQLGHMGLSQYVLKHKRFVAAMRKVDPNLVLVGSGDLGTKTSLTKGREKHDVNWSEGMLEQCGDEMDFISEHFYKGKTPWGDQPPAELPRYVALLKDEIRSKAKAHRELQSKLGRTPDRFMPIAMDEWNYWHRDYLYGELGCPYSLADALGVAAGLHEYFRNSDFIHMANYAQTVNVIGCIKTTKTAAFFHTTALPLLLYRREFGTAPLEVTGNQNDRALDVVAAKTKDGRAITIGVVNPQATPQRIGVKFGGFKSGPAATVWRIAGKDLAAHNTADKKGVAISEEKNVPFGEPLTVPAYSVSVYRLPAE